ncbi:flagellar export chaperone FliS [Nitrincola sp. MINF-07-Sa-05]|uniref:flagellar export chaperone FliS n=1 Tax=Nitrincola salilacus TaxID=3400273 RepID=UPI003918117D
MNKGINQYQQINVETSLTNATPHRLVQMLFEGALSSLSAAKGALKDGTSVQVATHMKKAATIIAGLEEGLDYDKAGPDGRELVSNLENLYQYMQDQLISAQVDQSEAKVDHIISLLIELKSAWDQIKPDAADTGSAS